MYTPLSEPVEAWHFDLGTPPEASDRKHLDVQFTADGRMNAVVFWFKLHLIDGIELSTGPDAVAQGMRVAENKLPNHIPDAVLKYDRGMGALSSTSSRSATELAGLLGVHLRISIYSSGVVYLGKVGPVLLIPDCSRRLDDAGSSAAVPGWRAERGTRQ